MGCNSSKPGSQTSNRTSRKDGSGQEGGAANHGSVSQLNDSVTGRSGTTDVNHTHAGGVSSNMHSNINQLSAGYDPNQGRFATCHFCYGRILEKDLNAHTVMCSEREVTCWNSWCRRMMKQSELAKHMEECNLLQKALCPKCGDEVLATEMVMHRDTCNPQPCPRCGEVCIKRIVSCCPHAMLAARTLHHGPFATEALRKKYLSRGKSPSASSNNVHHSGGSNRNPSTNNNSNSNNNNSGSVGSSSNSSSGSSSNTGPQSHERGKANYNVARMQLLWRWLKCRILIEEAIFRNVNKEMDLKKEGFAIFKAHDKANDVHVLAPKRSRSVIQSPVVAPATSSHYFPVNPNAPITIEHVQLLINDIKKRVLLPYPAAWRVFMGAMNHLNTLPNVVRLSPMIGARMINGRMTQGSKVVVVGDLHGQIGDLLHILDECGLPGESNYYVFNGDFVDRGPSSVEILLILFSLMLVFPTYVTLNRGNHECDYMNDEYGFDVEVSTKYDRNVFRLIQRCFCALPLATILDSKVFIVHGGLPRRKGVTINDISRIQRFRQIPIPDYSQPEEDEIFQDLLWSDPVEDITGWRDSQRGAGVEFGADLTEEFLRNNHLELVVRSHEECLSGYQEYHNRRLITVFSASNYDGPESNYGAVCTFIRDNIEPTFITYQTFDEEERDVQAANLVDSIALTSSNMARMSSFSAPSGRSIRQLIFRRSKNDILRVLRERIYQRRHRLMVYYSKLDRTNKGSVWMIEWVECMRNVLNLDLPWHFLRGYLTEVDEQSRVWYSPFLRSFHNLVQELWVENWKQGVCARLVQQQRVNHRSRLVSTAFNKDVVSYCEFCSVLRAIDYTISECQLFQLFQLFDGEGTGHVSGPLFIKKMQLIANSKPDAMRWDMDSMEQLQNIVIQARSQLATLFKVSSRDKMLPRDKFMAGMAQLARGMRKQLTQAQKDAIFDYIRHLSQSSDDVVNFDAFLLCVCVFDSRMISDYKLALFICLLELGMAPSPLKNCSFTM